MSDDQNPYRFAAAEAGHESDVADSSPFRQPETGRKLSADDVRTLAFSQRGLWICSVPLALWLCVSVVTAVAPSVAPSVFASVPVELHPIVGLLLIAMAGPMFLAWVGGLFFVLAIASRTHSTWLGFVLWFFALYPPIMLLMLPYLQSRAARALNRHGIPANLFGADWKSLPRGGAAAPWDLDAMTDDANPYRFSGDSDPASALPPDDSPGTYVRPSGPPILSPQEIRRLAFDRGWFALAVLLTFGWGVLTFYLIPRQVAEALIPFPSAVRRAVSITSFLAHLPAMIFAYRMQAFSNRSRLAAAVLAALLLMPFVKYLLAFLLLNDSRQILMRHGIRMGLLKAEHGSLPGRAFLSRDGQHEASSERS